jgi:hypothetical protein
MKYKVGDKVRVREDLEEGKTYYMEDGRHCNSFIDNMPSLKGKIVTINRYTDRNTQYGIDGNGFAWTDGMFESVDSSNEKIVIVTDGKTTLARLYRDDKVVKTAETKCSDDDKFDFKESAKIALNKLYNPNFNIGDYAIVTGDSLCHGVKIGNMVKIVDVYEDDYYRCQDCSQVTPYTQYMAAEELKPCDYYIGKAVCVESSSDYEIVGKVYNFAEKNGCGINEHGISILSYPATSLDEINERLYGQVKFIEFKGE